MLDEERLKQLREKIAKFLKLCLKVETVPGASPMPLEAKNQLMGMVVILDVILDEEELEAGEAGIAELIAFGSPIAKAILDRNNPLRN